MIGPIIIGLILVIVQYGCHWRTTHADRRADNAERQALAGKEQTLLVDKEPRNGELRGVAMVP